MATPGPVTVVDIQNALLSACTGNAARIELAGMTKIDTLLTNISMGQWEDIIDANLSMIVENVARLVLRAAIINYTLETTHRMAIGVNPFTFAGCDVRWCETEQMAQPMCEEDFPFSDPTINYDADCCPRIPFRRDGTLTGVLSEPRMDICLDCFYGARRRTLSTPDIHLKEQFESMLIYGAVGFLVPMSVRTWLIEDETTYFTFTEESPVWELGLIVANDVSDNRLIALLQALTPIVQ